MTDAPDLILYHGRMTALDRPNPAASAVAIAGGKFTAVGEDGDVLALAGPATRLIDLSGDRRAGRSADRHDVGLRASGTLRSPDRLPAVVLRPAAP
jgi:hypothetical protein